MAIAFTTRQATSRANGVTTQPVNLASVGAGNLLVLAVGTFDEAGSGGSVSGGGATWTRRSTVGSSIVAIRCHIYEGIGTTGGSITVTYTCADSCDAAVLLAEFSGLDAVAPFDKQAAFAIASGGGSTSPDSGATATLAQADELKISACCHSGGNITMVPRAGDGDTQLTGQLNGSTGMVITAAYQILSATTAVSGRWTLGSANEWCADVATFKGATGGATTWGPLLGLANNRLVVTS